MTTNLTIEQQAAALGAGFLAQPLQNFIGGQWMPAQSGETLDVVDPATDRLLAQAAAGGAADIDLAVKAARQAFDAGPWARMPPAGRSRLMHKLADAIDANANELALLESLDNGKPLKMARIGDVALASECLRYMAGWATKLNGETITSSMPGQWHAYTLREPIGVVGAIVPWNYPLMMAVTKIASALAAGCTVVLKPSEQTPLTAVRLAQLIEAVGFPPGVVNVVTGLGAAAGQALVAHPMVDKITFTGSTAVGKSIVRDAVHTMKRVTLELGGKSPFIVFPDANLEQAVTAAVHSIFGNTGQMCIAGSRLYVHRKVFDDVVGAIAGAAAKLRVGSGLDPRTEIGPLVSREHMQRVTGYIEAGRQAGAEVIAGGGRIEGPGNFVQPTVLTGTLPDMSVMREEIFGPVLCAMPFEDDDLDAIARLANDTCYGLSSNIWTRDIGVAHRLARKIKAGTVRVNAPAGLDLALPFGGYKESGVGRELGREGVEAYTELKSVAIAL
ncbi:aldehyde dehydrogenase family protein [Variovorax sp. dw_954]|uniref:aldehyde dehydrogenase family protein n=1 Tax=Variovorax sp. dw_954 TaxID=2720078 RepID=UPI001BD62095|nr:aldehyde dehydrogenase family protein [Variovorax sp. dw_954]